MTKNNALKRAARDYAERYRTSYSEALRRVKHLKRGDKVRVYVPGLFSFNGIVQEDQDRGNFVAIQVKRFDTGYISTHHRYDIEFLDRKVHRPHPKGWSKENVRKIPGGNSKP